MHKISRGHRLHGVAGLTPRGQASNDHERVESLFPQQVRHTGAGGFALSSTVEIDVFVLGERFDLIRKVIRLDSNRASDASSAWVVVAVAAHVD